MSNTQQMFSAGQAHGKGSAQAQQCADTVKDKMGMATDKAQENKEQAAGFLQQTGEQVKNMAQGAMDSVKSTFGVGDNNNTHTHTHTHTTTTTTHKP